MKVLLVGGSNHLMNQLILRMNKEGHRVYLLTGSKYRTERYEHVFERYDFSYTAQVLNEVFESVDPDVTIFMGAFDSGYKWDNERTEEQESVRFVSGVINLLMAYSTRKKGRFIYLSSDEVFKGFHSAPLTEEDESEQGSYKSLAIAQGENLALSYRNNRNLDVVTFRIGGLYGIPKNIKDIESPVTQMVLDCMRDHRIHTSAGTVYSPLFDSDAVFFIYKAAFSKNIEEGLYNISSGEEISSTELADLIKKGCREKELDELAKLNEKVHRASNSDPDAISTIHIADEIKDTEVYVSDKEQQKVVLSHARYEAEFGINRNSTLKVKLAEIIDYMYNHKDVFLYDRTEKKSLFKRAQDKFGWFVRAAVPFAENFIFFIPFFMLNNRATDSTYFSRLDFYLLYVLLFAIVHGQQQAIVSAMLASVGYVFRQMYDRTGFDVLLDYNTYVWIAQLFILGLVVGFMRDQLKQMRVESKEDHSYMQEQLSDIKDINSSNIRVKDALETQVITQSDSVGKIYEVVSKLDQYSSEEVLFYAAQIVEDILHCNDVSIYTVNNEKFARLFASTSPRARSLGKSVQYKTLGRMYEDISNQRVFINRSLDERYPMMANAIFNDGRIDAIIMVWDVPWERMTLGTSNLLSVVSLLIRDSVNRARKYLEALEDDRFVRDSRVLTTESYETILHAFQNAQKRNLTIYSLIEVKGEDAKERAFKGELQKSLRMEDYLGIGEDTGLYILLTNTDKKSAGIVLERLAERGFECSLKEG